MNSREKEKEIFEREKTALAQERTKLAYMRTGLAFIAVGTALLKLFKLGEFTTFIAIALIVIGSYVMINYFLGARKYRKKELKVREKRDSLEDGLED